MAGGGLHRKSTCFLLRRQYPQGDEFRPRPRPDTGWLERLLRNYFVEGPSKGSAPRSKLRTVNAMTSSHRKPRKSCGRTKSTTCGAVPARTGLAALTEKTCLTHIAKGFDSLGRTCVKSNGKLLITPSNKNMHAFLDQVRDAIHQNPLARSRRT